MYLFVFQIAYQPVDWVRFRDVVVCPHIISKNPVQCYRSDHIIFIYMCMNRGVCVDFDVFGTIPFALFKVH